MKKTKTIFLALILSVCMFLPQEANAQAPEKMSYQTIVRDASNNLIVSTAVGMQISILQTTANGTAVYVETHAPYTNANGLVSLEIGNGTPSTGTFAAINWANGPYFVKTEIDPAGGATYTITGTSQLLSVPYALHAKTAETLTGGITETDPTFTISQAANIDATDITNLGNLSGTNTGDQDISGIATNATAISIIQSEQTTQNTAIALNTAKKGEADGTASGQMKYWNGTAWVTIAPASSNGRILYYVNNAPQWGPIVGPTDVMSTTGKVWMDRNLGATQVATSSTDAAAYGDLYQWGRGTDGHQIRTSGITATISSTNQPGHGNFILAPNTPFDWRNPQNINLWQGVNGVNNPCPSGYRLPTETELNAERLTWSENTSVGAFASPLKLPLPGYRNVIDGSLGMVGTYGFYWSSTVNGHKSHRLHISSIAANMVTNFRAAGRSVRCIKD